MTTATKTAPKAFKWDEKNAAAVVAAYKAQIEKDEGKVETANSKAFLLDLATSVGAASDRSVRQKLAQMGEYIKGEAKSTAGTTGSTRQKKLVLASLISDEIIKKDPTVGDNAAEIFASLEHAGRPALLALLALLQGRPIGNEDLEA